MRILIAGCGYVGSALAEELSSRSHEVFALRRSPQESDDSVTWIQADLAAPETLSDLPEVDALVYCAAADGRSEEAYRRAYVDGLRNVLSRYRDGSLVRAIFTSSTAVYGDADGATVDETSATEPESFTGKILVEAEQTLHDALGSKGVVLRLAGIYGPTRTRLVSKIAGGQPPGDPDRMTNRIHRDDCAGVIAHLLTLDEPEAVYLGVDTEPAPMREVAAFIADELGVTSPFEAEGESSGGTRRVGSKRCSSARLIASGYAFRVPSYREGYPAICREYENEADAG